MKSLIIAGYGVKVGYRKGMLIVESSESKNTVSLVDLEQIIIVTSGVSVTSKAIRAIIEHGVDLVFLGPRGIPLGRVYPPFINRTVNTLSILIIVTCFSALFVLVFYKFYFKVLN